MDRYQLATLVKWAGTLNTRKRLQKVVYLLQAAGCELDVEYSLHHYGPYSPDVASLTDEMVRAGLLCEEKKLNMAGTWFSYRLSDSAREQLETLEQGVSHSTRLGDLGKQESLARKLLAESNLAKLEFAATIAYFHARKPAEGWDKARESTAKFKRQEASGELMCDAEQLAREAVDAGEHG